MSQIIAPDRVFVVRAASQDFLLEVRKLPSADEGLIASSIRRTPGGKGAYHGEAASRFGVPARFVGLVGRDHNGESVRDALVAADVDVAGLRQPDLESTGIGVVMVADVGENSIVVSSANLRLTEKTVLDEVVTSGPRSEPLSRREGRHWIPASPVDGVVACTGAGDAFVGILGAQLEIETPLPDAVGAATVAAALAVRHLGAQSPPRVRPVPLSPPVGGLATHSPKG